ncbi:NosD domain-containing protein [Paenibacillus sp. Marseille-Q4541]|uniref:right-handed parallel beta-helix repeat-containing protein n=1 Tax=Paenibacillus sp. Marseille-Q4541 TaxID=2831522 RepID=UPI001BA74D22|nr:NosD domain-containing protein [Paenibacillus sp. Marseille-Q4541]
MKKECLQLINVKQSKAFLLGTLILIILCITIYDLDPSIAAASSSADQNSATPLQPLIDEASEGSVLFLPEGDYAGPIIVDKKITIVGKGKVNVINTKNKPAIEISANNAALKNLSISHTYQGREAGVLVKADYVILKGLTIHTEGYGIMLRDAHYNLIQNNIIRGAQVESLENVNKGNGIDLYQSNHNEIQNNQISYVMDAIYIENSQYANVESNQIGKVRYAIHCMYVNRSSVLNNVGENNVTGAMVMGVKNSTISGNTFRKQDGNVNAQGMLLFDVQDSLIENNTLEGNRVGIYIQNSSNNQINKNAVNKNFVGIQSLSSKDNVIEFNDFISNVIEAVAMESMNNKMQYNYWDSFQGIDVEGDGHSDVSYHINPFYQNLVQRNSSYQLFFQSPGLSFLSDMFTQDKNTWSRDESPSMHINNQAFIKTSESNAKSGFVFITGILLFVSAIYTILYLGVRRS